MAVTVHVIVPLAAHIAPPKSAGIIGTVLNGLPIGVLLARSRFSGIVGD